MTLIDTYPAGLFYECAFNGAAANTVPPLWTDITGRTKFASAVTRGRQYEFDTNPAGEWQTALENKDGALDPSNSSSPFYPNVLPYKPCRIRALAGVNLLTADQATCGQGTMLPPGTSGSALQTATGVENDFGYNLSLVASGNAYTGSQVYQVTLPGGSTQFTTVLIIPVVPIVQGRTYSASAEVLITSGSSATAAVGLVFFDRNGNQLAAGPGGVQSITSGSSSWTTLTCTTQAPGLSTPATYAYFKIYINATIASSTTFQVGALQLENSASSTPWQAPQSVSRNMLPQQIATGSASINPTSDTAANYFYPAIGSVAQATFLTAAPPGQTTAVAWTTPSGTTNTSPLYAGLAPASAASAIGPVADVTQVAGSTAYTASVYLMRASSADVTVQVTASIRWFDQNGNVLTASSGTAVTVTTSGWVRATCTATSPATAAWGRMRIFISSPASTTATNVIYAAAWQFEQAGSVSAWIDPGPTYYIYNGLFERWPQSWLMNGTYGQVAVIGVDAEAVLAQDTLKAPFVEEVLAMSPNFFYQLNDPAGSTSCADTAGKRPPAPVENVPAGVGGLTFGSSITSTGSAGGFLGTPGPVATFANTNSTTGSSGTQLAETVVSLHKTTVNPGPPVGVPFTRILAFRAPTVPGGGLFSNSYHLWASNPASWTSNLASFSIVLLGTGVLQLALHATAQYQSAASYCDGNWHLVAIASDGASGGNINMFVDGALVSTTAWASYSGWSTDVLGCLWVPGGNQSSDGAQADVAHAIELPVSITLAQWQNIYNSWRSASSGESSGARAARVLNWAGWNGATALDSGSTQLMGPASDLTGATALDALNAISLTENGNLYVSNTGAITLKSRGSRYNSQNPMFTFGENVGVGEWPYEAISFDYDPTHLFNDVQVTQYSTSQVAEAINITSEASYYERVLQRTTNQQQYTETQDAAAYLLQQYSNPRLRISALTLHPSAIPGLFLVCLQLEIGMRIRIMRRPPSPASAIQFDGFVESINWDIEPDTGEVLVHLQCSPADQGAYWTLAALHTTLASPITAGASQASISALPDAAVNPLAASLPQSQQLTFDPGTAIAETLTIAPPLPATNPGYSSALVTFTSTFQHNHAAGATVCEALPTGYTDPTTWDVGSVLAPLYSVATGSGSNYVTAMPLPDSRKNPVQIDWSVGAPVWIAPGTARFQGYNMLSPNVSTAGEGVLPLAAGTTGPALGVTGDNGAPTVAASGSAFQGSNVWSVAVAANATTPSGLLYINKINGAANLPFTASAYVRSVTSGANPTVNIYIKFLSATGANLGQTNGGTLSLTGASGAGWTRASVTATAPAGTVWVQLGIVLTGTSPTGAWTFQADGLQVEQNSSASAYQTCPQISAIPTTVAGYALLNLTLANFTGFGANAGDYICEPLPPGVTNPTSVAATTRVAY